MRNKILAACFVLLIAAVAGIIHSSKAAPQQQPTAPQPVAAKPAPRPIAASKPAPPSCPGSHNVHAFKPPTSSCPGWQPAYWQIAHSRDCDFLYDTVERHHIGYEAAAFERLSIVDCS